MRPLILPPSLGVMSVSKCFPCYEIEADTESIQSFFSQESGFEILLGYQMDSERCSLCFMNFFKIIRIVDWTRMVSRLLVGAGH